MAPGSPFHLTEYFGPVLGIMTADSLDHAIELQNATPYGLTAGLFSLDPGELARWCEGVEAGNLYINRGITGAIVRRQPFGGWKRSSVGAGTKAGGPNYLAGLTNWRTRVATSDAEIGPAAASLLRAARDAGLAGLDAVERALRSDAAAWADEFGTAKDVSGLEAERNVLRYRPHPVVVRLSGGSENLADLVRVVAAGVTTGASVVASSAVELPEPCPGGVYGLRRRMGRGEPRGVGEPGAGAAQRARAPHRRQRGAGLRGHWRAPGHRGLRRRRHRIGTRGDAAVPARASDQHHRPPVRYPAPPGA